MPLNPKDFYSYFKECYKLDYKEFIMENMLSSKHSFKWFLSEKEELLSDSLPYTSYSNKNVMELEKEIELYKLEKKLFYACFFVLGKNNNPFIKDKRYCAPLFLIPADIITIDQSKFLKLDLDSLQVNRSVLTNLNCKDTAYSKDLFIKKVTELVNNNQNRDHLMGLKGLMDTYFNNINTEELLLHPNVWSVEKIRKKLTNNPYDEGDYQIVPSFGTVLLNKSESSLKVIQDLAQIASHNQFNYSLEKLLNPTDKELKFKPSLYKYRLNTDQYTALENTYKYPNSVIVGPPGTGKTYTITSIVSDLVVNNQSVLIVSKTKQAVEVLRNMLEEDFKLKSYIIHTTGNNYKFSLKTKVKKYLSGFLIRKGFILKEKEIFELYHKIERLEAKFEKLIDRELKISDLDFSPKLSLLDKCKKIYFNSGLFKEGELLHVFDQIETLILKLSIESSTYSQRKIQDNINNNSKIFRKDISIFQDALNAKSFTEYKAILNKVEYSNVLKIFPIWLANLSDLNAVLPTQKDLFDVVIIDEATQCDIATALPAIYRAKRVVIVGDPNQLRHYSFVSSAQQLNLQNKLNLPKDPIFDYRNRSVLDLYISKVSKQEQVSFLREHFRSSPSLIEFSNQKFYEGQLKVLKSTPKYTNDKQIEIINTDGTRNAKGVNEIEAKALIKKLKSLFLKYKNQWDLPTIGIISPFKSQVDFIQKLLKKEFNIETLKRHKLLCGTPYHFQGSEREIILLSFCICDQTHHSALRHANKPEVLNVAITRAKAYQYVFKSISDKSLKSETLLYDYFQFIKSFSHTSKIEPEKDLFQKEVIRELQKLNYKEIKTAYPVAGSLLDIFIVHQGHNYFIDLIGYPGIHKNAFSLERYKTFNRSGIKSIPLNYRFWKKNKKLALRRICKLLNNYDFLKIKP